MYFIEELNDKMNKKPDELSGQEIFFDDGTNTITFNWWSPEEGGGEEWQITFGDKISVKKTEEGHTVYGDFDNEDIENYDTIDDLMYNLKTLFE